MMTGFSGLGKLTKHYRSNLFHGLIFFFLQVLTMCTHMTKSKVGGIL